MKTQNVMFRADASVAIGTGHVMRCLTLAKALRNRGAQCRFLCKELPGNYIEYIESQNFVVDRMLDPSAGSTERTPHDARHDTWSAVDWKTDSAESIALIEQAGEKIDWLIVDNYELDIHWERTLRSVCNKLMVIDDLANRQHDCDLLLDQNLSPNWLYRYGGKVPTRCKLLLSPNYALLREEFRVLRERVEPRRGGVRRILISFGGVDLDNFTGDIIEALSEMGLEGIGISVDVVIGENHPRTDQILEACSEYGFCCHTQTKNMAELMMSSDLSIGAAGSTAWERCCLGLPVMAYSLADNQVDIAKAIELSGAGVYLGWHSEFDSGQFANAFQNFILHEELLVEMSKKSLSIADGLGANRVCDAMVN